MQYAVNHLCCLLAADAEPANTSLPRHHVKEVICMTRMTNMASTRPNF
jgi:hypothetical protein